jgi:hypothetical protein
MEKKRDRRWTKEQRIVVPVIVRGGGLQPFYGGDFPELKEGTMAELVLDKDAFANPDDLARFNVEDRVPILPAGTQLFACMRLRDDFSFTSDIVRGLNVDPPLDERSGLIPFTLEVDLVLHLRGTKPAELERCRCKLDTIPAKTAVSINNAYTLLSESYERWREAHTGNVFTEVYFLEDGVAKQLDVLRQRKTAEFEKELFRKSGLLPLESRTRPED